MKVKSLLMVISIYFSFLSKYNLNKYFFSDLDDSNSIALNLDSSGHYQLQGESGGVYK